MKIYRFSRIIAVPFLLLAGYLLITGWFGDHEANMVWAVAPVTAVVIVYLFQPQIDYWWLSSNPVPVDRAVMDLIAKTNDFYRKLSAEEKHKFEKRLLLYVEAKEFIAKGREDREVPYDVKYLIAQAPITITFYREDFLLNDFERIILYKHPFPSPTYDFLHVYETQAEDGVIILSMNHVEKGLFDKVNYYDVLYHGFAELFMKSNPAEDYPQAGELFWNKFEKLTGFPQKNLLKSLGFSSVDETTVLIACYFIYGEKFRQFFPSESAELDTIFINKENAEERATSI